MKTRKLLSIFITSLALSNSVQALDISRNVIEVKKEPCTRIDKANNICSGDFKIDFDQNSRKAEREIEPKELKDHVKAIVFSGKAVRVIDQDCKNRTIRAVGTHVILNRDVYNCTVIAKAINFPLFKDQKISGRFVAENIVMNGSKIIYNAEFKGTTLLGPFTELKNPNDDKQYKWRFFPTLVNVGAAINTMYSSKVNITMGKLQNVTFVDDKRYYPSMNIKEADKLFQEKTRKFILR